MLLNQKRVKEYARSKGRVLTKKAIYRLDYKVAVIIDDWISRSGKKRIEPWT